MFSSSIILAATLFNVVLAVPVQLYKRIDQTTIAAVQPWEQACVRMSHALV